MTKKSFVCSLLALLFVSTQLLGNEHALPEKFPPHPRIYFTKEREAEIRELMKTDEFLVRQVQGIFDKAETLLAVHQTQGPIEHVLTDGIRLMVQSWRLIERVTAFAFVYRMTGEQKYADAAITEMVAASQFPDWNARHFLCAAEMAAGIALGYDWLYHSIPDEKKAIIRNGLINLGLKPGLEYYKNNRHWVSSMSNWNEVCNNGMILAILAIGDKHRDIAEEVFQHAMKSIPFGLQMYVPEGTYPEGGNYWNYGTLATCKTLAAFLDVFGTDFGFLQTEGLDKTGDYFMSIVRPMFWYFNYSNCPDEALPNPAMFFLSRVFDRPDYAAWLCHSVSTMNYYQVRLEDSRQGDEHYRYYDRYAVLRAVWYNPKAVDADFAQTPLTRWSKGRQEIVTMRTAWKDKNAAYVGFKAGSNRAGHCHLDIGSFVYDIHGYRWAIDMGLDMASYRRPGPAWRILRTINRGHNTLLIDGKLQSLDANCTFSEFEVGKDGNVGRAVADLTQAYAEQLSLWIRAVTLKEDGTMIIEDKIEGAVAPVRWQMITPAAVEINGKTATLSKGDKKVIATIESNEVETFETFSLKPDFDYEEQNEDYTMLGVMAVPNEGKITIKVVLKP